MVYFIRDYDNKIVGNPKGYSTHRGASRAMHCKYKQYSKLRYYIWEIYDKAVAHGHTDNTIYSIIESATREQSEIALSDY